MQERIYYRLLPGCPFQLLRAEIGETESVYVFRNVTWCDISSAILRAGDEAYRVENVASRAEVRVTADAEPLVESVLFSDGVAWRNRDKTKGVDLPAPRPAGPSMEEYARYEAAWRGTRPLFCTEITDRFWRCGCGQVNEAGLTFCGGCDKPKEWVLAHADGAVCLATEKARLAAEQKEKKRLADLAAAKKEKRRRFFVWSGVFGGIVLTFVILVMLTTFFFRPARHYYLAERMESIDHHFSALQEYRLAGGYRDAYKKAAEMQRLLTDETRVAAGAYHTVIVDRTGRVQGTGYAKDGELLTSKWNAIRAVACGEAHTVGLHFSGTVIAVGKNKNGECNLSAWKDIVAIGAGNGFTVGLRSDGTVIAAGDDKDGACRVSGWKNVKKIAVGRDYVLGQTESGEMLFTGKDHDGLAADAAQWKDVVQFAAGETHAVGVTKDGKVVSAGDRTMSARETDAWSNMIAVSAGRHFTVGLRADGRLLACGTNQQGQTSVDDVRDAVGVITGRSYTISLQSDGSLLFFGEQQYDEGLVTNWSLK